METLVTVGAGLLGTVVGAGIAWFIGRRQHRLETVFAMHHEFHAPEMTRSRNLAGQTVSDHPSASFDAMRRKLPPEETQHVWNVMYFYQRLWLAVKYKSIHERYVPEMFGENFCWWYIKSYRDQLVPLDWQASRHVAALMRWIKRHADQTELGRWRNRAVTMGDPRLEEPDGTGSAEGSSRPGRLVLDSKPQSGHGQGSTSRVEVAQYLWQESAYRHDLIWRLLFRVTAVATTLAIAPFGVENLVARQVGLWIAFLPVLAVLMVVGSWPLVHTEVRRFQEVKGFTRKVQDEGWANRYIPQARTSSTGSFPSIFPSCSSSA
jgi:hypothetical protein